MTADVPLLRRCAVALLAALIALGACKSPEEKLVDRRQTLRATLDELYARYRSGSDDQSDQDSGNTGLLERFVGELDRSQFEEYCLATGRGERAFTFSRRVETFLQRPENAGRCRKVARLEAEIAALQREVATPR